MQPLAPLLESAQSSRRNGRSRGLDGPEPAPPPPGRPAHHAGALAKARPSWRERAKGGNHHGEPAGSACFRRLIRLRMMVVTAATIILVGAAGIGAVLATSPAPVGYTGCLSSIRASRTTARSARRRSTIAWRDPTPSWNNIGPVGADGLPGKDGKDRDEWNQRRTRRPGAPGKDGVNGSSMRNATVQSGVAASLSAERWPRDRLGDRQRRRQVSRSTSAATANRRAWSGWSPGGTGWIDSPVPRVLPGGSTGFGRTGSVPGGRGAECTLGEVLLTAASFGSGMPAEGQILSIGKNTALFSLIGTIYGGNRQTTFP